MNSAIARRYAKALFELAVQERALDATRASLRQLSDLLTRREGLDRVLLNPIFGREEHRLVLQKVMERLGGPPLMERFVDLLTAKHRLAHLPEIARHFEALSDERQGRLAVHVRAPRPMSEQERSGLKGRLEEALSRQVALSVEEDPELLAGITIQMGSRVLDGSVRGRLNELRRDLYKA